MGREGKKDSINTGDTIPNTKLFWKRGLGEMAEKERICILCGKREVMHSYICGSCQEKIQGEAMGKRREMREEAQQAVAGQEVASKDRKKE